MLLFVLMTTWRCCVSLATAYFYAPCCSTIAHGLIYNVECLPQTPVVVDQLWSDDEEVTSVGPGENIKVKLKGIEEEDVSPGFVLCDPLAPARTGRIFDAQVVILEHKSIICAGYSAVMHIHCVAEEVTVKVSQLSVCYVQFVSGIIIQHYYLPYNVIFLMRR